MSPFVAFPDMYQYLGNKAVITNTIFLHIIHCQECIAHSCSVNGSETSCTPDALGISGGRQCRTLCLRIHLA